MWAKRAALLLENRAKRDASLSLDLLRRIARERVPTIGRAAPDRLPSQRHRLVKSSTQRLRRRSAVYLIA
jgi:hypothetical protein